MKIQKKCYDEFSAIKNGIKKHIFNKETLDVPERKETEHEKNTHKKVETKLEQVISILDILQ